MLLENEYIDMAWHSSNIDRYVKRGYKYTHVRDIFKVKVSDVVECSSGAKIPVKCDYCGKVYFPTVRNYLKVRSKEENDCCISCKGKKIKTTVQQKYGVNNISLLPEVSEKTRKTCLERYGVEHPLQSEEIFQATQESFNEHYGTTEGIKEARNVKELDNKIRSTLKMKYGGDSPFASKEIRKKANESYCKNGSCKTSKKQLLLAEMLKQEYGNCELNYPCDEVSLDCMVEINGTKFDFEYDGWYWHKDRQNEDRRRDYFIESQGYKVIRIVAYIDALPTIQQIKEQVEYILSTNKNFGKIILNNI